MVRRGTTMADRAEAAITGYEELKETVEEIKLGSRDEEEGPMRTEIDERASPLPSMAY